MDQIIDTIELKEFSYGIKKINLLYNYNSLIRKKFI